MPMARNRAADRQRHDVAMPRHFNENRQKPNPIPAGKAHTFDLLAALAFRRQSFALKAVGTQPIRGRPWTGPLRPGQDYVPTPAIRLRLINRVGAVEVV